MVTVTRIDLLLSTLNAADVGTLESISAKLEQVREELEQIDQPELASRAAETIRALVRGDVVEFKRGRALFFEEAKVLAALKHPNIVEVTNFFRANDTVYMVMTYDYGVTLDRLINKKSFAIPEEMLLAVFNSLMAGVDYIHQQAFAHLDIKPGNILVRPGNDALLLDFGAIQSINATRVHKLDTVLTSGFSPPEQYDTKAPLGGWTDIYAIGASMRTCLDNKTPIPAPERAQKDNLIPAIKAFSRKYPDYLLKAIDWAMEVKPENRPQSIAQFKQALVNP